MRKKFILIDHSIVDVGGHHYEYAVHVLEAAERAGYKPILATNRAFRSSCPWEVHPVYTYGFWFRLTEPWWYRWARRLKERIERWFFQWKCSLVFSQLGLFWVIRGELGPYLRWQTLDVRIWKTLLLVAPFVYSLNVLRALKGFILLVPFRSYLQEVFQQIWAFLKALLYPVLLFVRPRDWMVRWSWERRRMHAFGRDTKRLFTKVKLDEGDIIFLPTISEVEMLGLLRFFEADPRPAKVSWHLLFRRNIYVGRDTDYAAQDEDQRPRKNAFASFKNDLREQRVFFYTDTDELTKQYNRLGVVPFRTLPIPHTYPPHSQPQQEKGTPLRIVYLGDARAEKGYHHLSRLVGDLWRDYAETGKVTFVFQSNFNIPEGEPEAVIARAQLEAFSSEKVRLIYEPLPTKEYRELLLSADIILLPYGRENYYARSSGILIEALAAGIPVVVPAGTWMARQFAEETYRYHQTLRQTMKLIASHQGATLPWKRRGEPKASALMDGEPVVGGQAAHAYCQLAVPPSSTHLLVSLRLAHDQLGLLVEVSVDQQTSGRQIYTRSSHIVEPASPDRSASVLLPLVQDARKICLEFGSAYHGTLVYLTDLRLDFLAPCDPHQRCPLGVIGLAYGRPEQMTSTLREVLDHYAHYRATTEAFAAKLFQEHNAARLIEAVQSPETVSCSHEH